MPRTTVKLKPCTVTMGKPFEGNGKRMCPVYEKMRRNLEGRGWKQKAFHAAKLPQGDMCYFKFDGMEKIEENGGSVGILYSLDVNIEGLNKTSGSTCMINMTLESFDPKNKLASLNHSSENELLEQFTGLVQSPLSQ